MVYFSFHTNLNVVHTLCYAWHMGNEEKVGNKQLTHVGCSRLHGVIMLCVHSDGLLVLSLTGTLHHTCHRSVE